MRLLTHLDPMPFFGRLFASIQARLLAVFLIITMLTVLIVAAFNQRLRAQLITEADNALLVTAAQIAERVDEFNRSNIQVFNVGSRLPDIVDFLQANADLRDDPDFRSRVLITLDSLEIEPWDEYYILSQAILDSEGHIILDTASDNIGSDESGQEYFRSAIVGGRITISPIQYRPERSGIFFYYAVPLREISPPNSIIGVLRLQISVASIQNITFESVRGHEWEIAIFDKNYVRIADTRHENLLFRSIASFTPEQIAALRSEYAIPPLPDDEVSVPLPGLLEILMNTRQDRVTSGYTSPDEDSEQRLAVIQLETVPWTLVISQPAGLHYEPVQQQITGILLLTISLMAVALLASYMISRRITEPIRALTAVAEEVAGGRLYIKAPVTSSDEVGTLAKTFNFMTTELETAHTTLEERVKERTRELSETNEKLTHEITERERYEKQALELALEHERRRILSEFIQKASHEFRTPLSIINVNTHLARRFLPLERVRHMNAIDEQSKYIEGLVNRMVLMARLDSGVSTPSKYLQIDDFIRAIHTRESANFIEQRARVTLDLQCPMTWIYADPDLLFIAIQNLLDNALKYVNQPAEITVMTCPVNDSVCISIQDNGVGIPENLRTRVFERFFRVDVSHTTRGFGLGLPIAKRIIENIGGSIELESEAGKGTTVRLTLARVAKTNGSRNLSRSG